MLFPLLLKVFVGKQIFVHDQHLLGAFYALRFHFLVGVLSLLHWFDILVGMFVFSVLGQVAEVSRPCCLATVYTLFTCTSFGVPCVSEHFVTLLAAMFLL